MEKIKKKKKTNKVHRTLLNVLIIQFYFVDLTFKGSRTGHFVKFLFGMYPY